MKKVISNQLSVMGWCLVFGWLLAGCSPASGATQPPTVDPYIAVAQAEQTSQAAQAEANFYGTQLTATAQAPIIAITSTAAAWAMEQEYARATQQAVQQTETAAWTATAMSWTATPDATSTTIAAQSIAAQTQISNSVQLSNLEVERAQNSNLMWAIIPVVGAVLGLVIVVMFARAGAARLSHIPMPVDTRGNPHPMYDVITGIATDVFTERVQIAPQIAARLPKSLPAPVSVETSSAALFPRPDWKMVESWEGKGIPYYTARGLEEIDLECHPHLASLGMTRSGKSRRFLRPTIAALLASGNRVVIIGKSTDYWVFENHPNATLIRVSNITRPEQALRYARYLEAMVGEMNRRDEVLTSLHTSTWARAGRARTFIVLDEFGNALRQMGDVSPQARVWVESLVSEGAKNGLNILLANQRATGMASILSQMGKAIFRVEPDEEKAHKSLIGASLLQDGYFFAKFGASRLAGAFDPSDDDLIAFLKSRPVEPLDKDKWIEGRFSEPTSDSARLTMDDDQIIVPAVDEVSKAPEVSEVARMAEGIRGQWSPGMRKADVARLLGYPQTGGSYGRKTDAVIEYLSKNTTTTATTTENGAKMHVLGLVGA